MKMIMYCTVQALVSFEIICSSASFLEKMVVWIIHPLHCEGRSHKKKSQSSKIPPRAKKTLSRRSRLFENCTDTLVEVTGTIVIKGALLPIYLKGRRTTHTATRRWGSWLSTCQVRYFFRTQKIFLLCFQRFLRLLPRIKTSARKLLTPADSSFPTVNNQFKIFFKLPSKKINSVNDCPVQAMWRSTFSQPLP